MPNLAASRAGGRAGGPPQDAPPARPPALLAARFGICTQGAAECTRRQRMNPSLKSVSGTAQF
eukprot:9796233-Alexandrium_andersonii.AAC.1